MKFFIKAMVWAAVIAVAFISLVLCLLEDWAGIVVSMALAPAIGIAMMVSEDVDKF